MGREFNGLVHNNQYYIYGFKIPKELYSKIKHKCTIWNEESQKLQQENQQLKEELDELNQDKVYWINKCANAETVLDEIREYIENTEYDYVDTKCYLKDSVIGEKILQILDKVKE